MIAAAVGAGLSAVSSLIGGAISRRNARKAEGILDQQKQQNEDWYARRYNEDYTQSAEAQRALTMARDEAMKQMQAARGSQAVMGGTEESVAQTQDAANTMIGNTIGGIAAQGTARKDAVESDYMKRKDSIAQQYQNLYNQRAQNAATQASQASQGFTNLAVADLSSMLSNGKGLFGDQFKSKINDNNAAASVNKKLDASSAAMQQRMMGGLL